MPYATQLLLKFKSKQKFTHTGEVRFFFNTAANPISPGHTIPLILQAGQIYLLLNSEVELDKEAMRVDVDAHEFRKKVIANELRFELDNESIRLTLTRSLAAAIMSQTHANNLHSDLLLSEAEPDAIWMHLKENLHAGLLYVAPIIIVVYLVLQYAYYYHKTGQLLQWDDPQVAQMLRDSLILGIQTMMITISFALARAFIPILLHSLSLQLSGPLIHLLIAPIFGLIFATSLLAYDLIASRTSYGQLTISPWTRFFKNFSIGTGLYLIQLFPFLASLQAFETAGRATLAFSVPNLVNYLSNRLPGFGMKPLAFSTSTMDLMAGQKTASNFYR